MAVAEIEAASFSPKKFFSSVIIWRTNQFPEKGLTSKKKNFGIEKFYNFYNFDELDQPIFLL